MTPTPWTVQTNAGNLRLRITGSDGFCVAMLDNVADANRIVHCVNTHEALVEALMDVMRTDAVRDDDDNAGDGTVYDRARAAIAKARGANP